MSQVRDLAAVPFVLQRAVGDCLCLLWLRGTPYERMQWLFVKSVVWKEKKISVLEQISRKSQDRRSVEGLQDVANAENRKWRNIYVILET